MNDLPASLFAPGPHRFHLEFQRSSLAEFHRPSPEASQILAERAKWIRELPSECLLWNNGLADPAIAEFNRLLGESGMVAFPGEATQLLETMGLRMESDLIFLNPTPAGEPILAGGCLCFPSSWRPKEKLGLSVGQIHSVVPGLNKEIGARIGQFLQKARPGHSWNRANWGLTASPDLNQNPILGVVPLEAATPPESLHLRVELQSLVRLEQTGAIVFGIRLWQRPLLQALDTPALRRAFVETLRALPDALAQYKRLHLIRDPLARRLGAMDA